MIFDTDDNVSLWLRIIAVALSIAIVVTGGLVIGWDAYFGRMTDGTGYQGSQGVDIDSGAIIEPSMDPDDVVDDPTDDPSVTHAPGTQTAVPTIRPSALTNLKANIKNWMNNGTAVRDDGVINILFIGMENNDSNGNPQPLSVNGRADAMCIISVNKNTKTITLASLLRDQYSYIVVNGKGRFNKFHHALSYAGPAKQIEMIERYYKIVIDNYVIVNFESLPKVINALGGVEITLTKNEASYLRNIGWQIPNAECSLTVDGYHALTYMRIRKGATGGDTARVGRQQKVILYLMNKLRDSNVSEIMAAANAVIPYVRTGLTSENILAYAVTAVTEGWLKYDIKQLTLPDSTCSVSFTNPEDGGSYWKVDFPLSAQKLQNALYGKSNIVLDPNRKKWF
ncbi:MAG: LCP family protein [Clostridia bacterium]|nr:LCP family protein [Clostridia bacterium]